MCERVCVSFSCVRRFVQLRSGRSVGLYTLGWLLMCHTMRTEAAVTLIRLYYINVWCQANVRTHAHTHSHTRTHRHAHINIEVNCVRPLRAPKTEISAEG